ncbi:MAG: hypothetical protein A2577_02335, partial [Bdellovibrionales bacterium RIFOXYD1_FULL_36_51]
MIHVKALPGTPYYQGNFETILDQAMKEASIYKNANVDGIIIENMHDAPYLKNIVGHEISTAMAVIGREIKKETKLPVGIQILAGANQAALSAALAGGLDFIRAEGFVFAHVADEGIIESCAGKLLRFRKQMEATHIAIWADIKKKHSSHAITADVSIAETAHAAEFFGADALIVTGTETGKEADLHDLLDAKQASKLPVIIGSGITDQNLNKYKAHADALIVGSWIKKDSNWKNEPDPHKLKILLEKWHNN